MSSRGVTFLREADGATLRSLSSTSTPLPTNWYHRRATEPPPVQGPRRAIFRDPHIQGEKGHKRLKHVLDFHASMTRDCRYLSPLTENFILWAPDAMEVTRTSVLSHPHHPEHYRNNCPQTRCTYRRLSPASSLHGCKG